MFKIFCINFQVLFSSSSQISNIFVYKFSRFHFGFFSQMSNVLVYKFSRFHFGFFSQMSNILVYKFSSLHFGFFSQMSNVLVCKLTQVFPSFPLVKYHANPPVHRLSKAVLQSDAKFLPAKTLCFGLSQNCLSRYKTQ